MANIKKCVSCGQEFVVSALNTKENYYCSDCERAWKTMEREMREKRMSINEGGQLRELTCPKCGKNFILASGGKRDYPFTFTSTKKDSYYKKFYCCSYNCLKQTKYEHIIEKPKFTVNEVRWLRQNHYEVPVEKMPKWMQKEGNTDGI